MKEYRIRINGGMDFVVVFPEVIGSLISKIRDHEERERERGGGGREDWRGSDA